MEMNRRLKVAIIELTGELVTFRKSSDMASRRIFWLTVVVAFMTAALVGLTIVLALKSWLKHWEERVNREIYDQISSVYDRMATEARYRPAAASDGVGNIPFPEAELDLDAERREYATSWMESEDEQSYWLGCPDLRLRKAMILAVEAARACCSADPDLTRNLLVMALQELPTT
jgi:hypothetical protein